MRELPDVIKSILVNHPANLFFTLRPLEYASGQISLALYLRSEFSKSRYTGSALGCALDCIACIAGYDALGYCVASESEVNFRDVPLRQEFMARASIESVDNKYASYSSSIYAVDKAHNQLVASASGTLIRKKNNLVLISGGNSPAAACAG
jgi:hypothetical protein